MSSPRILSLPLRRSLAVVLLVALTAAGFSTRAVAQDAAFDPLNWFTNLFKPPPEPGRAVKRRPDMHRAPSTAPKPKHAVRSERPRDRQAEKAKQLPSVEPTYFVVVLGDSLGQMLGQGLTEAFADRPEVAIRRLVKENSGLVRDDFYDWRKAAEELLASGDKINIAVIMIGSNDRQSLREPDGSVYEPRSPQWDEAYARRIETIAALFREKKIPLIWAGLPVMKSDRLTADASAFNDLYREHAEKEGAKFVDLWEAFAAENGGFSALGPDVNGEMVKLRAADGVHFTKAGARKLAHFIEPEIRRNLDETTQQPGSESPGISAPAEAKLPDGAAPAPGDAETEQAPPPEQPVAGPVLPLTGPVRSPGGGLASRAASGGPPPQVLRWSEPRPGRADDFSWPRN